MIMNDQIDGPQTPSLIVIYLMGLIVAYQLLSMNFLVILIGVCILLIIYITIAINHRRKIWRKKKRR